MMDEGTFDLKHVFRDFNPSKLIIFTCLFIQSVVLSLRLDRTITSSFWAVFTPLWIWKVLVLIGGAVGLCTWCRHPEHRREYGARQDVRAMVISTGLHIHLLVFEILLAAKLEGSDFSWRVAFIPVFVLMVTALASCTFSCQHKRDIELEVFVASNMLLFIFIPLQLDKVISWKWSVVLIPLWLALVIAGFVGIYFIVFSILVLRKKVHVQPDERCGHISDGFLYILILFPLCVFLALLVSRLDDNISLSFGSIFVPLHLSFFFLAVTSFYHRGVNPWWFGLRVDFCDFLLARCSFLQEYGNIVYKWPSPSDAPVNALTTKGPITAKPSVKIVNPLPLVVPD